MRFQAKFSILLYYIVTRKTKYMGIERKIGMIVKEHINLEVIPMKK